MQTIEEPTPNKIGCAQIWKACWLFLSASGLMVLGKFFGLIPLTWDEYWEFFEDAPLDIVSTAWPLFVVGTGIHLWMFRKGKHYPINLQNKEPFWKSIFENSIEGFKEEAQYRWIYFYGSIALMSVLNFLVFPEFVYDKFIEEPADFVTFGRLSHFISSRHGWEIGAAMLLATYLYQRHTKGAWQERVHSVIESVVLFDIMFHHGILTAMITNAAYGVTTDKIDSINNLVKKVLK